MIRIEILILIIVGQMLIGGNRGRKLSFIGKNEYILIKSLSYIAYSLLIRLYMMSSFCTFNKSSQNISSKCHKWDIP